MVPTTPSKSKKLSFCAVLLSAVSLMQVPPVAPLAACLLLMNGLPFLQVVPAMSPSCTLKPSLFARLGKRACPKAAEMLMKLSSDVCWVPCPHVTRDMARIATDRSRDLSTVAQTHCHTQLSIFTDKALAEVPDAQHVVCRYASCDQWSNSLEWSGPVTRAVMEAVSCFSEATHDDNKGNKCSTPYL